MRRAVTLDQLADVCDRAERSLGSNFRAAEKETLGDARRSAELWTSGNETLAQQRRAGHPHARRHGHRRRHPVMVNRQSDAVHTGWMEDEPREVDGGTMASLYNTAPHGRYLFDEQSDFPDGGTKFTFGRDVPGQVAAEIEERRETRLGGALERSFR